MSRKVPNPSFSYLTDAENRDLGLELEYTVWEARRKRAQELSAFDPEIARRESDRTDRIE